ncbi:MAG: protein kinase [Bryobacterales bacterium]|nr:protein kinase [Bryobacterales bacterium]
MQLKTGDRIGDYEVLGVLGAGGMGSVYKVRNVISDRVEAIKLLLPNLVEHQDLKERFLREIKTSASLEHTAIAGLRTAFQSGDMLMMVMEFVDGQTLDARLRQGQPGIEESVRITASVLDALEYAHSRGVVHRDIKPANIMLSAKGGVKLLDFGIAKATTDKQITVAGTTMGSLYYMSPEQIRGEQVDGRADLYSLGITLYELTTGKRPFGGESGYAIMAEHLQKQPVPPIEIAPGVSPALSAVILRSLAKNPDDRYQTAAEFRQDLLSVLSPEESTLILGHSATRPAAQQTAATLPSAPPMAAFASQATQAAAPPVAPPVKATPPPSMQPPLPPAAPVPQKDPFAAMDTPRSAPSPAPAFAPVGSTAPAPRKPSSALALVMVALIAVVVLGAVVLVFAGSWFFGSSDTTMANAEPTLAQRIGSLFSSSESNDGNATATPAPDTASQESGELASPAPPEGETLMAANTPGTSAANPQGSAVAASGPVAVNSTARPSSSAPSAARPQSIQGGGSSAAGSTANTASAQLGAAPGGSYSGAAQTTAPYSATPVVPAGPDPRELESAQDFLSKLGIRAGTIQESARKLSEEQSGMGVSLRADMRASIKRMEYLMDQAEAALNRGSLQQAQQHMQGAEREIEKLEKFFRI